MIYLDLDEDLAIVTLGRSSFINFDSRKNITSKTFTVAGKPVLLGR